ncbi:undecaprenyl-diphosphate phosphatase [Anaerosphaera multitolerans]|uniref:Undecaprenyl-diphosphatase n=1 Tax=Anaerosphaera multitolerans TaxID=2487351 RepID=A0A437S4N0_9FIRM|nr:undecaprenyl-diphosphate phosphatase [Anaerosphaera multitolerans]RVU53960.1 undecaprenyl-diphosphate phosphatase [Anaerosphaera multitolerans]
MDFLKAIILGIIEGLTEFLPVSSTGHLILANEFISFSPKAFDNAFNVIIQLGAILSVVVIYFNELNPFAKSKVEVNIGGNNCGACGASGAVTLKRKWDGRDKKTMRLLAKIIIGVLPAVVLGFLFDDLIDKYLFNKVTVSLALVFYGIVIIFMENRNKGKSFKYNDIDEIPIKTVLLIGFFQCLAMVPGTSRSAATIIGAMILGCSRTTAAEFSFFLAIPTMIGATGLKVIKMGFGFTLNQWLIILLGSVVSFIVAYVVIVKFMDYIKKHDFKVFGVYRIVLGIVVLTSYFLIK